MGSDPIKNFKEYIEKPLSKNDFELTFFLYKDNFKNEKVINLIEKLLLKLMGKDKIVVDEKNSFLFDYNEQSLFLLIHQTLKWEFNMFLDNDINEKYINSMSKLMYDYKENGKKRKSKNNFIILAFTYYDKIFDIIKSVINKMKKKEVFFIFFIEDYNEKYKEKQFEQDLENIKFEYSELKISKDCLKIFELNPDKKEDNSLILFKNVTELTIYYNELGDFYLFPENILKDLNNFNQENYNELVKLNNPYTINLLVMGRSGAGKSTLINKILNKKKCKSSEDDEAITEKITKYKHDEFPLVIYDTPGISENKKESVKNIIKLIKQLKNGLTQMCQEIHILFFVIDFSKNKKFFGDDGKIIINILKLNIPFFFIFTHSKKIYNKEKKIYEISLLDIDNFIDKIISIINSDDNLTNSEYKDKQFLRDRIISVNLVNEPNNKEFGMEEVYDKLYDFFRPNLIPIEDIDRILNDKNLQKKEKDEKIQNYVKNKNSKFFKNLITMADFLKIKNGALKFIVTQFFLIIIPLSFCPIPFVDDAIIPILIIYLIINISSICNKIVLIEEAQKMKDSFGITVSLLTLGSIGADVLKTVVGIGTIIGGVLDLFFNSTLIVVISKKIYNKFIKEMIEKGIGVLLYEAVKSYNEATECFIILKKNYLLKIKDFGKHA